MVGLNIRIMVDENILIILEGNLCHDAIDSSFKPLHMGTTLLRIGITCNNPFLISISKLVLFISEATAKFVYLRSGHEED